MTYTVKSPLTKTSGHYTADQLWAAFKPMTPPDQYANARRVLKALVPLCVSFDLDEVALAAIIWIETGAANTGLPFRSSWYLNGFNLGNIGITGDPAQNAAAQKWTTPEDGVLGLVAHAVAYAYGSAWRSVWDVDQYGKPQIADKRFDLVLKEYGGKPMNSIEALNGRWAWDVDNNYDGKLAERANKVVAAIGDDPPVQTPSTPPEPIPGEGDTPMATPVSLDYSSLSFPVEVRLIPAKQTHQRTGLAMTPAYSTWHDTGNPNPGTDAESHADWMLDGCRNDKGEVTDTSWHFTVDDGKAIQHIPLNEVAWHAGDGYNGLGNRTSIAIEECVNSDRDAAKTRRNAAELHAFLIKALKLQGGTVNALVQHNRWSGKDCPAEIRRLGLWPSVVSQVSAFLAAGGGTPSQPSYAQAHPISKGSQIINEHVFLAPGGKTFQAQTTPREYGDPGAKATGPDIAKGTKITQDQISHYVVGTDSAGGTPNIWLVLTGVSGVADGSRVPAEAVIGDAL